MHRSIFLFILAALSLHSGNFVLFTEPKTGTHLLIPILETLTGKRVYWAKKFTELKPTSPLDFKIYSENPNFFFFSIDCAPWPKEIMNRVWKANAEKKSFLHLHAPFSPTMETYLTKKNCINIYLKRDPRDRIVSLLNHYKNIHFNDKSIEEIPNDDTRLLRMIEKQLRKETLGFMGWLNSPQSCVLEFSKLMGSHGGAATDEEAIQELQKLTHALEISCSDLELCRIYQKNFGKGWNFFKGKVGSWREYFNEEHKAAAKREIGDLLIELGFEKNYDW